MATTAQSTTWLIFRIGRVACAVPALAVETIVLPPEQLTALPGSDAGRPGLFRHIHDTVAAIDLRYRFGLHDADHRSGRLLLGRIGPTLCGFWVDSIIGMVDSSELAPTTLPPELPHNVFTAALLYRKEIVLCSDLNRLHAMRDAGAALQRMVRPEPEPEEKATAADENTGHEQRPHTSAATTTTATTGRPAAVEPATSSTVHAPSTASAGAKPTAATHHTAHSTPTAKDANHHPATTSPLAETTRPPATRGDVVSHAAAPARPSRPITTPRAIPSRKSTTRPPAAPARRPAPETPRTASPLASQAAPEPNAWQETAPSPTTYVPEPVAGKGAWAIILLLLLVVATGGWYALDTGEKQPALAVSPPPPTPVFTPLPTSPAAEEPPPAASTTITAPPADQGSTTLVAGQGIAVQQDREGITIIIERAKTESGAAPAAEPAPVAPDDSVAQAGDEATAVAEVSPEPAPAVPPAPPPSTPTAVAEPEPPQMYVHTVVKGDTLWDIAERYLDDPWRYKDLAQLSRIKNPDLIYPGNKIRIIIR